MTVILTQEVQGLNVGDPYTGGDEEYLLASGYARRDAQPAGADPVANPAVEAYTGPGVSNTGPADTTIANERTFTPVVHQIAATSDLPVGAENDGIVLVDQPPATIAYSGTGQAR